MPKATKNENPATASPSSARTRLMIADDQPDAEQQPDDRPDQPRRRLDAHRLLPRQAARRDEHLAQRAPGEEPCRTRPASTAIQRVLVGWVRAVLICAARLPVMPASSISSSPITERRNPRTPTDEQQQGDEEQEQPEGDGAADDRAGALAVALVDAQPDVDDGMVAVPLEQLLDACLARGQPLAGTGRRAPSCRLAATRRLRAGPAPRLVGHGRPSGT